MIDLLLQAFKTVLYAVMALAALAQAPSPAPRTFEAASIKANTSGERRTSMRFLPGGRIEGVNRTLKLLIQVAYDVRPFQILGGPDWLGTARFDISATANADVSSAELRAVLRSLLAERFKLRVHHDTRDVPIYALHIVRPDGRPGPGLKPAAEGSRGFREREGSLGTDKTTMTELVKELTGYAGRPIVDRTGLRGDWQLTLNWTPDGVDAADPDLPSIFTAVREQLGLRLEATRGPAEMLVIDGAEKPTED
jgi:uncharacterized protein (TIGR03435 family)